MRHLLILSSFILTFFISCTDTQLSDNEVEQKAYAIIKQLDKNTIDTFRHWSYGTRGEAEIWGKLDTPSYGCFYFKKDTLKLSVGLIKNFREDFPFSLIIDTSRIHQIIFKKINDEDINIAAWTNFGRDTTIAGNIKLKSLFPTNDPFRRFAELSKLKDNLQIIGTFYRPDIGNFIQFYLTNLHILTYFPDILKINSKFKDVWMDLFFKR